MPGVDPVVALDGGAGPWLPAGMPVVAQRGNGLAERIAAAFDDVGGPALLIGMDTPQVTKASLSAACVRLASGALDAVFGPAVDGGWWAIGLRAPDPLVFSGVPMSTDRTADVQRARLRERGLAFAELPCLRDVDLAADARVVAEQIPRSRFAQAAAASAIGDVEAKAWAR